MRRCLLLLIIVLCTSSAWAQQGISARVIDFDGKPLEYCNVVGYTRDSVFVRGTITDSLGNFNIANVDSLFYLRFTSLGYTTQDVPVMNFPAQVRMAAENIAVGDVVVEGRRPKLVMQGGKLRMNVKGTILSERPTVDKVLSQIPGLTANNEGASLIGGGTLVTLIDGRRVLNASELQALDPKDIESITMDRAPGARYGSEVRAVLNIRTVHRFDQLSVLVRGRAAFNHLFSHWESAQVGYHTKKAKFLFYASGNDKRVLETQRLDATIVPAKELRTNLVDTTAYRGYYTFLQVDLFPSKKINAGVSYHFIMRLLGMGVISRLRFNPGHAAWEDVISSGSLKDNSPSHHVNSYVTYKPTSAWEIELETDVFTRNMHRRQYTHEREAVRERDVNLRTDTHYLLWQLSPRASYSFTESQKLEVGVHVNRITGDRKQYVANWISSEGRNNEELYAAYTNYSYAPSEKWSLSAGLRYERANSRLNDLRVLGADVDRTFDNLFFSGKIAGQIGKTTHQFDVSSGTQRPLLEELSNHSVYINKFLIQESNPNLIPSKIYRANYTFNYGPLFAGINYQYTRNHIAGYMQINPKDPDGYVLSNTNYKHHHRGQVLLGMEMSLAKWYSFSINGLGQMERIDGRQYGLSIKMRPLYYGKITHTFTFPWFNFSVEYSYRSAHTMNVNETGEQHMLEASVWKSFFDGRLYVNIVGEDLLAARNVTYTRIGGLAVQAEEYSDTRCVALFLRYRFNASTSKNRKSAASESIDRL